MNKISQSRLLISTLAVALVLFIGSSICVFAQSFLEPTSQAPIVNVLDFLNQSEDAQGRNGKLQINQVPAYVFTGIEPVVYAYGNAVLQGNTVFDYATNQSTLTVNTEDKRVISGVNVLGKKFAIKPLAAGVTALYAESTDNIGISAASSFQGGYGLFGQTVSASANESAGIRGVSTNVAGAGIFAYQADNATCNGLAYDQCLSAKFTGNLIVVASSGGSQGKIIGDGRGVTAGWTLYDTKKPSKNIAFKTFTVLALGNEIRTINGLSAGESFISMSVMVDGKPYNPSGSTQVEYIAGTDQIKITNGATPVTSLVVHVFYSISKALAIVDDEGTPVSSIDAIIPSGNEPYNGNADNTPLNTVLSGGLGTETIGWVVFRNDGVTPCAPASECGSFTPSTGESVTYNAPSVVASPNNQLKVKAYLIDEPSTMSNSVDLNVYKVKIPAVPSGFVELSTPTTKTHQFTLGASDISCPVQLGACPSVIWSLPDPYLDETVSTGGLYTSPTQILSSAEPVPWKEIIKVQLSTNDQLFDSYQFELIPQILIREQATPVDFQPGVANPETQIFIGYKLCVGGTNDAKFCFSDAQCPGGGVCEVSNKTRFQLFAYGAPDPFYGHYKIEIEEPQVNNGAGIVGTPAVLSGEKLEGYSGVVCESDRECTINNLIFYYVPPASFTDSSSFTFRSQWIRRLKITFAPNGIPTSAVRYVDMYLGKGEDKTYSANLNTTVTSSARSVGFLDKHRIKSICTTPCCGVQTYDASAAACDTAAERGYVYDINYSGSFPQTVPGTVVTCGTLKVNTPSAQACDNAALPKTNDTIYPGMCYKSISFSYTAASSVCNNTLYIRYEGEPHVPISTANDRITLDSKQAIICSGCNQPSCNNYPSASCTSSSCCIF